MTGPYRIAVEEAKAALAAARLQVKAMQATYRQKLAEVEGAEDTLEYQQREFDRQRQLAASGVAARSTFDQVQNAMQVARQKVVSAQSEWPTRWPSSAATPACRRSNIRSVQRAQAALDKAELDLSMHDGAGAEPGIVTKVDQLQVGSYVDRLDPGIPDDLEAGLDRGQLQGDRADAYAAGPDRDGRDRHLSRDRVQRDGRKPEPGHRLDLLAIAGGERHR